MLLSEFKNKLQHLSELNFFLENSEKVPSHFHVTEVGQSSKKFIDCGGTMRNELTVNFQLWYSTDQDHRLVADKLRKIIALSEEKLDLQDAEIEVEYQQATIGKFGLKFQDGYFVLTSKTTACLDENACGIPLEKPVVNSVDLQNPTCTPGSGCC